jgi:hypothetical protein
MVKINVKEEIDNIKNELIPIKDEVCIVHDRIKKYNYIVTFDTNLEFIKAHLSIISVMDFTEEQKMEFFLSNEDIVIFGREDFLK